LNRHDAKSAKNEYERTILALLAPLGVLAVPACLERVAERLTWRDTSGMRAYSIDLRERVVRAVTAGMSKAEAARVYDLGLSTVKRYVKQQAAGHLRAKPLPGRARRIGANAEAALRAQVAAHPDATLDEHRQRWAAAGEATVSRATMSRTLARLGLPLKKSR
jgi:transposase